MAESKAENACGVFELSTHEEAFWINTFLSVVGDVGDIDEALRWADWAILELRDRRGPKPSK